MTECTEEGLDRVSSGAAGSPGNAYLLCYGFNQDYSCFVCGTTSGFRVYTASPVCEVHRREHSSNFQPRSVSLIAMLFKTNIFAMVTVADDDPSANGANKVQIWDDQKGKFVGELRSRNEVKGVVLRRDVIAMVCEYAIYVYTCDKLRVILHLTTNANPRGLCVLAPASDPWILCCPGQSTGAVRVQVGQDDHATHVFTAHNTALAGLALNSTGSLVATASEMGTVVKVFQTVDGQLLYRLRRSARPTTISSLAFRADDKFLAVASSSPTVHIFKLDPDEATRVSNDGVDDAARRSSPRDEVQRTPSCGSNAAEGATSSFASGDADVRINPTIDNIASSIQKVVSTVASRAAVETMSEVVKGVMPRYFNDLRSFAQFRIPDVDASSGGAAGTAIDARCKQSQIIGPQVAFHKSEPKFFVLHHSGVIYECSFNEICEPNSGTQECGFQSATTWFAVRPDFKVQGLAGRCATVAGGADEDDREADEWQLL